jgi:hypothetical protein
MVAPSVYRAGHLCSVVWAVAALFCSWLESAEPLRKVTTRSVRKKLDDHTADVGIICKYVLPAQIPVLLRKVRIPSIPGNNIHDTFPTGTWPDTTRASNGCTGSDVERSGFEFKASLVCRHLPEGNVMSHQKPQSG